MSYRPAARPRLLHPAAWWGWALLLAVAASRMTNPWLCLLLVAVLAWTVAERREPGTGRILGAFLVMGLTVLVMRLAVVVVLGGGRGGRHLLLQLPSVPLPSWMGGLHLGGPVYLEVLVQGLYDGGQLAAVLACFGAANALAGPRRLLRYLPATLYDIGTALVVGLTYAPRLVEEALRLSRARRLRGRAGRGVREGARLILPMIAGALDGALALAASMESRGYGRVAASAAAQRRSTAIALLGLVGVVVGTYGLLDGGTPAALGLPTLVVGLLVAAGTVFFGAGRDPRSRYRRDPFGTPEVVTLACGLAVAAAAVVTAGVDPPAMTPTSVPLRVPDLPLLPVLALVIAGLPAVLTPPVPRPATDRPATDRPAGARDESRGAAVVNADADSPIAAAAPLGAAAVTSRGAPEPEEVVPRIVAPAVLRGAARLAVPPVAALPGGVLATRLPR